MPSSGVEEVYLAKYDGEGKAGDQVSAFSTTDIPIYCVVLLESSKATVVKMNFVAVSVSGVKADTKVVTASYTTKESQNRVNFTGRPDGKWTPGKYRVDIFLDGKSLKDISLASLRQQIAMVSQHVVLFDDTIAANIAYGDPQPDFDRISAAVKAAHLNEVLDDMPDGLNTSIGDNGMRLSGGQRQRLAIARAVYKNAPILILDEATSALDTESERAVQAALDELMLGRTTLVIAHRLSTIERASRIAVLVDGRIVEIGTHAELLNKEGVYANLYRLQFTV